MPVEDDAPHIEELAPATGAEIESWHAPEFWDADPVGRQEKAFDPHEKRDTGGKWSKTGGGTADGKAKAAKPVELTDEQRELLRSLHEHFPDGIGHLLTQSGHVDRAVVFPDEEKHKAKIEEHRHSWRATDEKISALLERDKPALQRVADDEAFKTRINEQLPASDNAFDLSDYDDDKEVQDALAEVVEMLETIESGDAPPEDDDYIDHDEYTINEDDAMPEESDDPDTFEDQAELAGDAAKEHAERVIELKKLVDAHAKTTRDNSAKWRAGIAKQLGELLDSTAKALKFGPERYVENQQYGSGGKVIGAIHDHDTLEDIKKNVKPLLKECSASSSS